MISKPLNYKLSEAAKTGNLEAVERALLAGADIHANDDYALQLAAHHGHTEVVGLLLKAGADVHADNELALRWACGNKHLDVVGALLKSGADIIMLCHFGLAQKQITGILKQHAATAYRGYEAVMLLKEESTRVAVLRHLHPDLKPKQIREELAMAEALGLDAVQMGEMWKARYGGTSLSQEAEVAP